MHQASGYATIILAAGNSSRLGEPKQLLKYQGKTLIRHVTKAAIEAKSATVIVVTGSNSTLIEEELASLSYHAVQNVNWESGMASSIVAGVQELMTMHPNIAGVILAVSDQPFVTSDLFNVLIDKALETKFGIVASEYDNTFGTPVLFSNRYFPALLTLSGAEGAKKLVKKFTDDATSIPFPLGSVDIDTQADYQKLLRNS
ncbi:nucleotidyltransferase family protein [Dyadobacter chenwenxiniae]|uniref:Nucleotidyltransferase family protein n=1 Tax=Dyadobacter chenwenxiniae TaxID=2906456 RepID=A0A9X1PIP7_9BACT|nr:nucleotidyltransferase family protein [Dyadobacter chenwenxiniae]MCF0060689.1 nucleotidyltransferase family protein [Dyadobacter chenwenxiniae]UON80523.1 nucleotidyltransferase family protein [Dyadobacter chenwenxiniae]